MTIEIKTEVKPRRIGEIARDFMARAEGVLKKFGYLKKAEPPSLIISNYRPLSRANFPDYNLEKDNLGVNITLARVYLPKLTIERKHVVPPRYGYNAHEVDLPKRSGSDLISYGVEIHPQFSPYKSLEDFDIDWDMPYSTMGVISYDTDKEPYYAFRDKYDYSMALVIFDLNKNRVKMALKYPFDEEKYRSGLFYVAEPFLLNLDRMENLSIEEGLERFVSDIKRTRTT